MKTIIESWDDALALRQELSTLQTKGWHLLYRGHASNSFELLPIVGRKTPINGNLLDSELHCYQKYKRLITEKDWTQYMMPSYNEDLFYMSIGRHLGLDCRLLDWTAKLETALFFASVDKDHLCRNGHLWIRIYQREIVDIHSTVFPLNTKEVTLIKECFYCPNNQLINDFPLGAQRRFAQNGFFSIVPSNMLTTPLDRIHTRNFRLINVEITTNAKKDILNQLTTSYSAFLYKGKSEIEDKIKQINSQYFK